MRVEEMDLPDAISREAPRNSKRIWVHNLGDDSDQPVRYFVYADMLEALVNSARQLGSSCAVLHGNFGVDPDGGFVEISGFENLGPCETPTVKHAREQTDEWIFDSNQGRPLLGLFYCLPDSEALLTEELGRIFLSLLNVPFQVIAVFDPNSQKFGLYTRLPRGKFRNMAIRWVKERS